MRKVQQASTVGLKRMVDSTKIVPEIIKGICRERAAILDDGFAVPDLVTRFVESLRERSPGEQPFHFFVEDREVEWFHLCRLKLDTKPWGLAREQLPLEFRSTYIDWLATSAQLSQTAFGTSYGAALTQHIDPSEALYMNLKLVDLSRWQAHLRAIDEMIESEAGAYKISTGRRKSSKVSSSSQLLELVRTAASKYVDCEVSTYDQDGPTITCEFKLVEDVVLRLTWCESRAFFRHGKLQLVFDIRMDYAAGTAPLQGTPAYTSTLERLLPGALHYTNRCSEDVSRCLLAIDFHLSVLSRMRLVAIRALASSDAV